MPYVRKPGIKGKFYVPEERSIEPKKNKCPDCKSCQGCSESRCRLCVRQQDCARRRPSHCCRDE